MIIPHFRPDFDEHEAKAARDVILSQHIAQGEMVAQLESRLCGLIGRQYGCAVSSGTSALTLGLLALNTGPGDEVIIPSYTCSALWHAIKAVGASPIFADIESRTFNLDPQKVKEKISPRVKAVIFPHMFGQPGYIEDVVALGIPVIEDIAQAVGAKIGGKPAGALGRITVMSFYATKMLGAGEGGAILTDSAEIAEKIKNLRQYDELDDLQLRFNAKMTDITAAIALEQVKKLDAIIQRRKTIFTGYANVLNDHLQIPVSDGTLQSNYYRCVGKHPRYNAEQIIDRAQQAGIRFRKPVFKPLHLYGQNCRLTETESAWERQFSIPLYPALQAKESRSLEKFLRAIY